MRITAVEHEISHGNWTTKAEFDRPANPVAERTDVNPPLAHGMLSGIGGLRWARLAHWQASAGFGAYFVPEVGDEVVVGFFNEDPNHPVVLGSLYSARRQPPANMAAATRFKSFTTRGGHRFELDDEDKVVTLPTQAGNRVVLSDQDKSN